MRRYKQWIVFIPFLLLLAGITFADDPGNHEREWDRFYDTSSTMTGFVFDEAGAPLANSVVTVSHIGLPIFSKKDTSDAAGIWAVGKLMPGFYMIKAEKADFIVQYYDHSETLLRAKAVALAKNDTLANVSFHLSPGAAISGTVYFSDGITPLSGAAVSISKIGDVRQPISFGQTITDANGNYRIGSLASGGYLVLATREGYLPEFWQDAVKPADADTLKLAAPEEKTGINFSLSQTSAIAGIITSETTNVPIADAYVAAYSQTSFGGRHLRPAGKARSDENGIYIIPLQPGNYLLTVEASGYVTEWFDNVTTADLATPVSVTNGEHTLANFQLKDWGGLSGKVTDAITTLPLSGATIQAFNEERGFIQRRFYETTSLADGTYEFSGLPSGRYILMAKAAGYLKEYWQEADSLRNATIVTMADGNDVTGIDFTLVAGASIAGVITGAADRMPLAGAFIEAQSKNGRIRMTAQSDLEGKYTIKGLESGSYLVNASLPGYIPQWYDSVLTRSEATPVVTDPPNASSGIDFSLSKIAPLPRSISGIIVDDSTSLPVANAQIMAIPVRALTWPRRTLSTKDGAYSFTGLSTGQYVLLISARGYQGEFYDDVRSWRDAKVLEVMKDQELTGIDIGLSPQSRGAYQLAGQVVDNSGAPVEGALVTLTAGDQNVASAVTAEDGQYSFEDVPADSYSLMVSAAGYEDSTPSVESLALSGKINVYGLNLLVTNQTTNVPQAPPLPSHSELEQNYPNPFNPSTRINFTLAQPALVRLTVYDMLGREIRQLTHGEMAAGQHSAIWDGADSHGAKMASGIYFCRLEVRGELESFTKMRRMVLIK